MVIHELRGRLVYGVNTLLSNGAYECREFITASCAASTCSVVLSHLELHYKRLFSRQRNFTLVIGSIGVTALQMSFVATGEI